MYLQNTRLIDALFLRQTDLTPIWIMRQAGRYLPEYRKLRARAGSFLNLCKNPQLALEITMQPLARFELDAAILFSDILTIPDAMGMGLYFVEGEGPSFRKVLDVDGIADIASLDAAEVIDNLGYVTQAVSLIHNELAGKLPLIGFSGSPWTLAVYMLEGGASKQFLKAKAFLYQHPDLLHQLLAKLAEIIVVYINAQIEAGAKVIQIFDTWGGLLTPEHYQQISLNYMQIIAGQIKTQPDGSVTPVIFFTKGGGQWLQDMLRSDAHGLGIDWTVSMQQVCDQVKYRKAIQGNLDPALLHADNHTIRQTLARMLQHYGAYPGHIANLGHGITQDVKPEKVDYLVKTLHELSAQYHVKKAE